MPESYKGQYHNDPVADFEDLPFLISDKKKRSSNKKRAKQMVDYVDTYCQETISEREWEWMRENYDLYNGRWPQINQYSETTKFQVANESISYTEGNLEHYPILDQVARSIVGDEMLRPLVPMIQDTSTKARNQFRREKSSRLKKYINNKFVMPIVQETRQKVARKYMQQYGVKDPYSLKVEAQKQMRADMQRRVEQNTPKEIQRIMDQYQTPEAKQAQTLINHLIKQLNLKEKFDMGYEHSVIVAMEFYRIGMRRHEPFVEVLNPLYCRWTANRDIQHVENADRFSHVRYLLWGEIFKKYGDVLEKRHFDNLKDLYSPIEGPVTPDDLKKTSTEKRFVDTIAANPELQEKINPRTREGQDMIKSLYSELSRMEANGYGIRESYNTWIWNRPMYEVKRIENGKIETYYRDEYYEENPEIDWEVNKIRAPQAWEGIKLGIDDKVYPMVQAVPYQYKNINNPFETHLPVVGDIYNTLQGNSRNRAIIDLGKKWNYRYDVQIKRISDYEKSNIGRVFKVSFNSKPDDWSWTEWFTSIVEGRIAVIDDTVTDRMVNMSDIDAVDMSNKADINYALELLQQYEQKIITSMHYNPSKLGLASPYITKGANEMNIRGSDRQLMPHVSKHNSIMERVLNELLNTVRAAYQDNDIKKMALLDDYSIAELDIDFKGWDRAEFGIHVVNDYKEREKVERLKANLQPIIQSWSGSMMGLARLMNADNMTEVEEICRELDKQREEQRKAANKAQAQGDQKEHQNKMDEIKLRDKLESIRQARELKAEQKRALIQAEGSFRGWDIDENKMNDQLQAKKAELETEKEIEEKKLEQAKEEARMKHEREMRKLDIEEQKDDKQ